MAYFGRIHFGMITHVFIQDMNYQCEKFDTNISTNIDTTNIFPFFAIFSIEILLFYPKIANFESIQLGNVAYIVSEIMNYHYAKFHAFIRKLMMNVIFHWL